MTPWTVARQAPLSMEFSKQEYWCGLPFSPPGDHNDPGIKPSSFASPSLADRFFINCTNWEVPLNLLQILGLHKFSTHFFMDVQECRVKMLEGCMSISIPQFMDMGPSRHPDTHKGFIYSSQIHYTVKAKL